MSTYQLKRIPSLYYCNLFLCFLLIFSSCTTEVKIVSHENASEAIIAQEREALDQWALGNPIGFAENFAEDITYYDDIAAQSRIEGLDGMKTYLASLEGKVPPHNYELVNPKVQVYEDVGILTTHYSAKTTEGEALPLWKATSVYRWIDREWRVVHANWSLVKENEGES